MICKHCGEILPQNAKYCPNCAEPTSNTDDFLKRTKADDLSNVLGKRAAKGMGILVIISLVTAFVIAFIVNDSLSGFWGYFFGVYVFGLIFVVIDVMIFKNSKRKSNILVQFDNDKTSICPRCGSHSVKVYRKGYNWQEAFWGSVFKIRGSRYTAGMDSNEAMCYCQRCGHKWNTHYDIRTIK